MQKKTTHDMIFSCADIISYVSAILPPVPDDLIVTGTPQGGRFLAN